MVKIDGKYKFWIEVAGNGFVSTISVWGTTQEDAVEEARKMIPGCTEIRSIEITDVSANDVKKAIHARACELEVLCYIGELKKESAFDELVKYVKTLGNN